MTEKRFYLEDFKDFTVVTLRLYDKETDYWHLDWLTESHKIVGLLNEFAEENEQIKKENNHIHNINKEYREENLMVKEECIRLREENEQLKQRINSRLHFYRELYDSTKDIIAKRVVEDLEDILR